MFTNYFITGTDTDCGKTHVACALVRALRSQGLTVAPYKPVAAGAELIDNQLQNEDAIKLIEAAGASWAYEQVNPYCFPDPVSPHLTARDVGVEVELEVLKQGAEILSQQADCLVVEGAGGWFVPLSDQLDIADLAVALNLPVILVVGLRLGCLNHARLSAQAIQQSGVPIAGWIGTQVDPNMERLQDNLETLKQCLPIPFLGFLAFEESELSLTAWA